MDKIMAQEQYGEEPPVENDHNWQVTWCYQQVQDDKPDFDNLYCTGNTLIMIFSGINMCIFSYLLYLHIRIHWSNTTFLKICLKVKTSVLALIIIY